MKLSGEGYQGKKRARWDFKVSGVEELKAKLDKIGKKARGKIGKEIVAAGALRLEGEVKTNINETFSKRNTGGLKNSVATAVNLGQEIFATVEVGKEYARIQEFGGRIEATKAKALHWEQDGEHIFAKAVTLPPRPYFQPALFSAQDEMLKAMGAAAEFLLQKG